MNLVYISVTTLEEFRRYKQFDYITDERMIDRIKGVRTSNPAMNYGTDFWTYVEKPEEAFILPTGSVRMPEYDTYLPKLIVAKIDHYRACLQSPVFEVPVRARYEFTDLPPIIISGRFDVMEGNIIRDGKTTKRFDYETYEDSLQWRFYLDMLGLGKFIYDVFEKKGVVDDPNGAKDDDGKLLTWPADVELHSFPFYTYLELKRDCRYWIAEFMAFVRLKNLTDYVTRPFEDDKDFTPVVHSGEQFFE